MKQLILSNWHLARVLRLMLGIYVLAQGILTNEWLFAAAGGIFAVLAIMNIGCCGASGCNTATIKSSKKIEDTIFEEVK